MGPGRVAWACHVLLAAREQRGERLGPVGGPGGQHGGGGSALCWARAHRPPAWAQLLGQEAASWGKASARAYVRHPRARRWGRAQSCQGGSTGPSGRGAGGAEVRGWALSLRGSSEATYGLIPNVQHWKGQSLEILKRPMVSMVGGVGKLIGRAQKIFNTVKILCLIL